MNKLLPLFLILILTSCASEKSNQDILGCSGTNVVASPDPTIIAKIIDEKIYDLRWCHQSHNRMSSMPEFLAGEMTYNFTLNNLGKVVQSTLDTKMTIDENTIKCMKGVLDRTQFQCSQIKENVSLTQIVKFHAHDY
jgi:hypothetical protein